MGRLGDEMANDSVGDDEASSTGLGRDDDNSASATAAGEDEDEEDDEESCGDAPAEPEEERLRDDADTEESDGKDEVKSSAVLARNAPRNPVVDQICSRMAICWGEAFFRRPAKTSSADMAPWKLDDGSSRPPSPSTRMLMPPPAPPLLLPSAGWWLSMLPVRPSCGPHSRTSAGGGRCTHSKSSVCISFVELSAPLALS